MIGSERRCKLIWELEASEAARAERERIGPITRGGHQPSWVKKFMLSSIALIMITTGETHAQAHSLLDPAPGCSRCKVRLTSDTENMTTTYLQNCQVRPTPDTNNTEFHRQKSCRYRQFNDDPQPVIQPMTTGSQMRPTLDPKTHRHDDPQDAVSENRTLEAADIEHNSEPDEAPSKTQHSCRKVKPLDVRTS